MIFYFLVTNKESSVASENRRRKSVAHQASQSPVDKLMTSSWKYDYKTTAWEGFMNKTGDNKEFNKIGHYRRRQDRKVNVKEGASALDSVDAIFKGVLEISKEEQEKQNHNDHHKTLVEDNKVYINDISNQYFRPNSSSITGCQRKHNQKNTMTNFQFRYTDLEIPKDVCTPNPSESKEKKLSIVEINKNKHDDCSYIGNGDFAYMKDSAVHKRGRNSNYSNERTYGSQVRYLPGSVVDQVDIIVPKPVIKLVKANKNNCMKEIIQNAPVKTDNILNDEKRSQK